MSFFFGVALSWKNGENKKILYSTQDVQTVVPLATHTHFALL
jgi:hypothetical protein